MLVSVVSASRVTGLAVGLPSPSWIPVDSYRLKYDLFAGFDSLVSVAPVRLAALPLKRWCAGPGGLPLKNLDCQRALGR